jgi:hypothetical protein
MLMASASKRQDYGGARLATHVSQRYASRPGAPSSSKTPALFAVQSVILCNVPRKGTNAPGG